MLPMPNEYRGEPSECAGRRFAVVVSKYNDTITRRLLDGALATLEQHGVASHEIDVAWVPGLGKFPWLPTVWPVPATTPPCCAWVR